MLSFPAVKLGIRRPFGRTEWILFVVCGLAAVPVLLLVVAMVVGMGGMLDPFPPTDITNRKPYVHFIGRECRVAADVRAIAWNDFPDKSKILGISLMPPPWVKNRFVSYETPLKPGQRLRIESANQRFALIGFNRNYIVSVPGAGLPDGIPITMYMNDDGVPDSHVCEPVEK
jgi:hypothetical protein